MRDSLARWIAGASLILGFSSCFVAFLVLNIHKNAPRRYLCAEESNGVPKVLTPAAPQKRDLKEETFSGTAPIVAPKPAKEAFPTKAKCRDSGLTVVKNYALRVGEKPTIEFIELATDEGTFTQAELVIRLDGQDIGEVISVETDKESFGTFGRARSYYLVADFSQTESELRIPFARITIDPGQLSENENKLSPGVLPTVVKICAVKKQSESG